MTQYEIRTTQREETMTVLENLSNTIHGAAADLRKLKKENAELKARIAELENECKHNKS
jgi:cell division protein FtsB